MSTGSVAELISVSVLLALQFIVQRFVMMPFVVILLLSYLFVGEE